MDGQCLRVAVASLFSVPVSKVPPTNPTGKTWDAKKKAFVGKSYNHADQIRVLNKWLAKYGISVEHSGSYNFGLQWESRLPEALTVANGGSPRFNGSHAVVWDARPKAKDFERPFGRLVHDPAPKSRTSGRLTSLDGFYVFHIVDPSKLHRLSELYPRRRSRRSTA